MNTQFKKGVLEMFVLILSDKKDRYGYELVQQIAENIEIAEGTVYPLLRRLTKEGYFTTYLVESKEGPPRKYYRLTDTGRSHKERLVLEWNQLLAGAQNILKVGEGS